MTQPPEVTQPVEIPVTLQVGHDLTRVIGTITHPGDLPGLLRAYADLAETTT